MENVVLVRFEGLSNQTYAYKVPKYLTLKKKNIVVVEAGNSYSVALVVQTVAIPPDQKAQATKYVVQVVDIERLREYKENSLRISVEDLL